MKIAINGMFFQPKAGGIKEYIYNIVQNLFITDDENEYILYVLEDQYVFAKRSFHSELKIKTIPFKSKGIFNKIKRSFFSQKFWDNEEKNEKFDIFHSPFFYAPKFKKAKIIITVHDLRFKCYPQTYEFKRYLFLRYAVKKSLQRCNHIVAISFFTKAEIIKYYDIVPDKITVIHNGVDINKFSVNNISVGFQPPIELVNSDFLLYVAHIEKRKNHIRLMQAFENVKKKNPNIKLVLVGQKSNGAKKVMEYLNKSSDIIYLNFVSNDMLNWLYANARLFLFPSYYEGFGLPPLEAGALGLVSVVSNKSSIPEVCEDISFYFDPFDVNDISEKINYALSNNEECSLKRSLIPERIKQFTWEDNVSKLIKLYTKIKCRKNY